MKRVDNPQREEAKAYLCGNVDNMLAELSSLSSYNQSLIISLNNAISGSVRGIDWALMSNCQQTQMYLSQAMHLLFQCQVLCRQLETEDWINDD